MLSHAGIRGLGTTSRHLPRPPKSFFLHFTSVHRVHGGATASRIWAPYITACLSHIPPTLSGVAEYRQPPERGADIELVGRLWGGAPAAKKKKRNNNNYLSHGAIVCGFSTPRNTAVQGGGGKGGGRGGALLTLQRHLQSQALIYGRPVPLSSSPSEEKKKNDFLPPRRSLTFLQKFITICQSSVRLRTGWHMTTGSAEERVGGVGGRGGAGRGEPRHRATSQTHSHVCETKRKADHQFRFSLRISFKKEREKKLSDQIIIKTSKCSRPFNNLGSVTHFCIELHYYTNEKWSNETISRNDLRTLLLQENRMCRTHYGMALTVYCLKCLSECDLGEWIISVQHAAIITEVEYFTIYNGWKNNQKNCIIIAKHHGLYFRPFKTANF